MTGGLLSSSISKFNRSGRFACRSAGREQSPIHGHRTPWSNNLRLQGCSITSPTRKRGQTVVKVKKSSLARRACDEPRNTKLFDHESPSPSGSSRPPAAPPARSPASATGSSVRAHQCRRVRQQSRSLTGADRMSIRPDTVSSRHSKISPPNDNLTPPLRVPMLAGEFRVSCPAVR